MQFTSATNRQDFYWRLFITLSIICAIIAASDSTFATTTTSTGTTDIIGDTLCRLAANLTGGIGKGIATIAIFVIGVSLFMGKVNWGTALATAAGVTIIFGSAKLVGWISGGSGAGCDASSSATAS